MSKIIARLAYSTKIASAAAIAVVVATLAFAQPVRVVHKVSNTGARAIHAVLKACASCFRTHSTQPDNNTTRI